MGVTTRADEALAKLKDNLRDAQRNLTEVLNPDTWGSDEYTDEYNTKLLESFTLLIELRNKIGK